VKRLSTGISELDKILLGGIPKGTLNIVIGPPGSGKSILGLFFLWENLKKGFLAILINTHKPKEVLNEELEAFNLPLKKFEDKLIHVDCFSWRIGDKNSVDISSLTNTTIAIDKILEKITVSDEAKIVIDSFSDFLLLHPPESVFKFLETEKFKFYKKGITCLIVVEEGIREERITKTLEFISDGTIKMKIDESGRFLMISRMIATPVKIKWIPFHLSKGLKVRVEEFFR